jgi:hypothetical protein
MIAIQIPIEFWKLSEKNSTKYDLNSKGGIFPFYFFSENYRDSKIFLNREENKAQSV